MMKLLALLTSATLLLIFVGFGCTRNSAKKAYSPIDENTEQPYSVLMGYLKRRGDIPEKTDIQVKSSDAGFVFRWQQAEKHRLFQMEERNGAWLIQEIGEENGEH